MLSLALTPGISQPPMILRKRLSQNSNVEGNAGRHLTLTDAQCSYMPTSVCIHVCMLAHTHTHTHNMIFFLLKDPVPSKSLALIPRLIECKQPRPREA